MNRCAAIPKLIPLIQKNDEKEQELYSSLLSNVVHHLLSKKIEGGSLEAYLSKELPLMTTSSIKKTPCHLSVYLLCKKRPHIGKFFIEMMTRWLLPGKVLNIPLSWSMDFRFEGYGDVVYTLFEIQIPVERQWDCEMMLKNLSILTQEIHLGVGSTYQAQRILEMRGLSGHDKVGLMQEAMSRLIERFPYRFDYDMFTLMQQCLVVSREEFKRIRECRHLSRIMIALYLLRKQIVLNMEMFPQKRHVLIKLKQAQIHLPLGVRPVLFLCVALNLLGENEVFAKRHLIRAIQTWIPDVKAVEESYLEIEDQESGVHLLYLEIEKEDKEEFTLEEIRTLKQQLPSNLKGRVEHLLRPIFMPRNEEEVMRNIIVLSHQLKYVKDLPQVVISFDEQTDKQLSFTIILVRLWNDQTAHASILLKMMNVAYEPFLERERKVGKVRNTHDKEALVIRMKLPSSPFLREDDSVDLYVARREVLSEIQKAFGEVRDFNGGMISKQSEAFLALKKMLGQIAVQHKLLLENFFHSIYPIECRSTLNHKILSKAFLMLLEPSRNAGKKYVVSEKSEEGCQMIFIDFYEIGLKQKVLDAIGQLGILSRKLIQIHLQTVDAIHLGYIHLEYDEEKKRSFFKVLSASLES